MKAVLNFLIRAYQRGISAYTPASCIYSPVCSNYARQAIARHGALKGSLLSAWRILKCNPWRQGGLDPVPAPGLWKNPKIATNNLENPH